MSQITLLGQVVQLLPRDSFKKLVRKHLPIKAKYKSNSEIKGGTFRKIFI